MSTHFVNDNLEKGTEIPCSPVDKDGSDADFGGFEARQQLERKLLWKIDARMSIMVFIYILNYVGLRHLFLTTTWLIFFQVDRNNAGAARLQGFEADLKLKGESNGSYPSLSKK